MEITKIKIHTPSETYRIFSRYFYGGGVETTEGRDAGCCEAKYLFNSVYKNGCTREDYVIYNPKTHTVFGWDSYTYIVEKQLSDAEVATLLPILKCNNYIGVKSPNKLEKLPEKWELSQNVLKILELIFPSKWGLPVQLLLGPGQEVSTLAYQFGVQLFEQGFRFFLTVIERLPAGSGIYNKEISHSFDFFRNPPHRPNYVHEHFYSTAETKRKEAMMKDE